MDSTTRPDLKKKGRVDDWVKYSFSACSTGVCCSSRWLQRRSAPSWLPVAKNSGQFNQHGPCLSHPPREHLHLHLRLRRTKLRDYAMNWTQRVPPVVGTVVWESFHDLHAHDRRRRNDLLPGLTAKQEKQTNTSSYNNMKKIVRYVYTYTYTCTEYIPKYKKVVHYRNKPTKTRYCCTLMIRVTQSADWLKSRMSTRLRTENTRNKHPRAEHPHAENTSHLKDEKSKTKDRKIEHRSVLPTCHQHIHDRQPVTTTVKKAVWRNEQQHVLLHVHLSISGAWSLSDNCIQGDLWTVDRTVRHQIRLSTVNTFWKYRYSDHESAINTSPQERSSQSYRGCKKYWSMPCRQLDGPCSP